MSVDTTELRGMLAETREWEEIHHILTNVGESESIGPICGYEKDLQLALEMRRKVPELLNRLDRLEEIVGRMEDEIIARSLEQIQALRRIRVLRSKDWLENNEPPAPDELCAHGCGFPSSVEHVDGRLLCGYCYAAETLDKHSPPGCPTCAGNEP